MNNKIAKSRMAILSIGLMTAIGTSPSAMAWNECGHKAVAGVAFNNLDANTKTRAMQILVKLDKYPEKWSASAPRGMDKDQAIFMKAAYWPDEIKRDNEFTEEDKSDLAAGIAMSDPSDKNRHNSWHYINVMFSNDGSKLPPMPTPNVKTQILQACQILKSNAPDDVKAYALAWLLHLVGDVHQPLHSVARVNAASPNGDEGGGEVVVQPGGSLHSFWDSAYGIEKNEKKISTKITAANWTAPTSSDNLDIDTWIKESVELAKKDVYRDPVGDGVGTYRLNKDYKNNAATVASERIKIAGYRLAGLLNKELK